MMGFQAMQPKTTGSLIWQMAGARHALPRLESCFDLERMSIMTSGKVQPMPPHHR